MSAKDSRPGFLLGCTTSALLCREPLYNSFKIKKEIGTALFSRVGRNFIANCPAVAGFNGTIVKRALTSGRCLRRNASCGPPHPVAAARQLLRVVHCKLPNSSSPIPCMYERKKIKFIVFPLYRPLFSPPPAMTYLPPPPAAVRNICVPCRLRPNCELLQSTNHISGIN